MLVRVRDSYTGHRYTAPMSAVDADPERFEVLDSPAVDAYGRPLPPDTSAITDADAADVAAEPIEAHEEAL